MRSGKFAKEVNTSRTGWATRRRQKTRVWEDPSERGGMKTRQDADLQAPVCQERRTVLLAVGSAVVRVRRRETSLFVSKAS